MLIQGKTGMGLQDNLMDALSFQAINFLLSRFNFIGKRSVTVRLRGILGLVGNGQANNGKLFTVTFKYKRLFNALGLIQRRR